MTDLKELIEQEIDQYLEWPTADKSHVTAVSAKLFAEHVARLYADHIAEAGGMVAPAVQGEPTDDELLDWAGEEQFFLFCDRDEFLQIARAVMHRYMGRQTAVQGEPVFMWHRGATDDESEVVDVDCACPCCVPLYLAPQPAPDVAGLQAELARELQRRFDGNEQASREHREDMKALVEALEASTHRIHERVDGEDDCRCSQCRFVRLRDAALAAHRKQQESSHDNQ